MTSCSHVAPPPASRWWIVSVEGWRTWRTWRGSGTWRGVRYGGQWWLLGQGKRERSRWKMSRVIVGAEASEPGEDGDQLFSFTVGDPGSLSGGITYRTETDGRQVKWSLPASRRILFSFVKSAEICWFGLKTRFPGKRLYRRDLHSQTLSLSSHMCEQEKVPREPKMPKQTKVFLSHVNLLFLVTALA